MLTADKNATLTEFQIQTMHIREKELNYFVSLYNAISGKCAILLNLCRNRSVLGRLRLFFVENELPKRHICRFRDNLPRNHSFRRRLRTMRNSQRCNLLRVR